MCSHLIYIFTMPQKPLKNYQRVIFAAMSKRNFYLREHIIKFVLQNGLTPTCAFMMYSYFLLDTVERKSLIAANNSLIRKCDELWVFGQVSDGVAEEIKLARKLNLPVKFYTVSNKPSCKFIEIKERDALVESP